MIDEMIKKMKWLGHDTILIRAGGKVIYFDPFQLAGTLPPADIILVSHEHYDHCSPEDIEKIQTESTVITTEPQAAKKLQGRIKVLKPGENCEVGGIHIEAVPMHFDAIVGTKEDAERFAAALAGKVRVEILSRQ